MAFFDKLSTFAQNLTDKANDTIETGKLNSKVNSEKNLAGEELKKIGTYYYEKFANGEEMDPAITEFLNAAKAHYDAAAEAQAEIDKIREENEAAKAAAEAERAASQAAAQAAAATPVPAAEPTPAAPEGIICPSCGAVNSGNTKFCGECGTKLEIPQAPVPKICSGCGAEIAPGLKFCGECGTRVE
ncbi:MAG: zinc ribbon domain-containing protein [Lachnospiraceae bacterium]|nr:zinc ribbon domain-containing protein [Lachnospiraceae bacterium]